MMVTICYVTGTNVLLAEWTKLVGPKQVPRYGDPARPFLAKISEKGNAVAVLS
jgi:hypothetical protein